MQARDRSVHEQSVWERTKSTALGFLFVFGIFTPLLLLVLLFGGREVETDSDVSVRVDLLLLLYPLGATIAGALLGALAPYARGRISAALIGMVAMAPWMTGINLALEHGHRDWSGVHTITTLLMIVIFGAGMGQVARE